MLRERYVTRSNDLRSVWATSSAAIFFLAETEAYLQAEVVAGLWDGFQRWLITGSDEQRPDEGLKSSKAPTTPVLAEEKSEDDDIWLAATTSELDMADARQLLLAKNHSTPAEQSHHHDPQTLTAAHRLYLHTLTRRLLLTQQAFTDALYELLVNIDRFIALIHRLQSIWTSMTLKPTRALSTHSSTQSMRRET